MHTNASFTTFDATPSAPLIVRDCNGEYFSVQPEDILQAACAHLGRKMQGQVYLDSPGTVREYLRMRIGHLEHEVFGVVHLDAQHRVLATEEMFRGTLTQASVYPREVVKECMRRNTAAVLMFHNHPSGTPEPSRADELLTQTLSSALKLVDVRVLDHLVVTSTATLSFAERGLI